MSIRAMRIWAWTHKWSSLVCTVFLLMLCVTGLPLIFHHEIDELLHESVEPRAVPPGTRPANLDQVIAAGMATAPKEFVQFVIWDEDDPNVVLLSVAPSPTAPSVDNRMIRMDANTAAFLDAPDVTGRFTYIMLKLHSDMFAGLPGKLFLGLMGFLFCIAVVSGIVLYAPSMRKLSFGTFRRDRSRLIRWLDLHNILGVVTIVWALVVGFTGVINTWADLVLKIWQYGQLTEMVGPFRDAPLPATFAPVEAAVATARAHAPGMNPSFVAYPGTAFTSRAHYAVFMRGDTPLTARLFKPVLIDASTGAFTDTRDMPWYVTTLLVSQPLHFGDYGGMPLKIIWAILDVITIVILATGLYLWIARRRPFLRARARLAGTTASTVTS